MAQHNGDDRGPTPEGRVDAGDVRAASAAAGGRAERGHPGRPGRGGRTREPRAAEGAPVDGVRQLRGRGDAKGGTREPERKREALESDSDGIQSRQSMVERRARVEALQLDRNERGLEQSADAIADTRDRVRALSEAADTLAHEVDHLRRRTERIAASVRRTAVRELDAPGDAATRPSPDA